jgi:hypothetical protein
VYPSVCAKRETFRFGKRTNAKLIAFGEVEGLHPVLIDVQVESLAHVDGLVPTGVGVTHLGSEQMQGIVALGVLDS